ncbi:MAG TPA: YceI family protein [Puia sp.]|nr:YceI family protein [Puia sp.]
MTRLSVFLSAASLLVIVQVTHAQTRYAARNGFIGFYSKTPLEDITAENNQAFAIIDTVQKNLAFAVLMKGFIFRKELMQEHFNENYVESDKYPKAEFSGSYSCSRPMNKPGVYPITVRGNLTLHGVTKMIEEPATLEIRENSILGNANFNLKPEDFEITIPGIVRDKIDKEINVRIRITWSTQK